MIRGCATTSFAVDSNNASFQEVNQFSPDELYSYHRKEPCCCGCVCGSLHCSPNQRVLYVYNANGYTPYPNTLFKGNCFMRFPTSTANRVIIPLDRKTEGGKVDDNFKSLDVLAERGIDASLWSEWTKRMEAEVANGGTPMGDCMTLALFFSIIGIPYCCYRIMKDSSMDELRSDFMSKLNAEVLEPRQMFGKICESTYTSGGDNPKTYTIWWMTIALNPEHVRALKMENDCLYNHKKSVHEEDADGHCDCGLCNLYCY